MANVNAPSGQTPTMAPPVRVDDQILPHIRKHMFHPRPDSPLHLSNEEPVLGYLKFSAKGTKSEVFGMPIPDSLITAEIQQATYYREYMAKVTHHRKYLAGETGGVQNPPALKPTQPARKPKAPTRPSISIPVASTQPAPISAPAKSQEINASGPQKQLTSPLKPKGLNIAFLARHASPKVLQSLWALEERMKDAYALPKGPLPPVDIRVPESGKYQPLPEVPGKGKAKVTEEQLNNEEESEKVVLGAKEGGQDEGQAGPDPNAQAKDQTGSDAGQAGPDPGDAEAKVQSISSPVVHAGSDREHMDLDVTNGSPQPSTEQPDEGFTATVYPNIQENLKLAVEEPVLLEEPASSSGTLSSLQHLSRDFSFGDQFFSDKHSNADKNAETKVESMVMSRFKKLCLQSI
nr:histone deacetylase 14 [Tanacetum cinerariifolium]